MDLRLLIAVQLTLGAPVLSVPGGSPCPKPSGETSSCVCKTSKGVVDLRSVANDNGVPRFRGLQDSNKFVYEYNPCYPFSTIGSCTNVHIKGDESMDTRAGMAQQLCQETQDIPPLTYKIADAGTEQMYLDSSGTEPKVSIFYTSKGQFGTNSTSGHEMGVVPGTCLVVLCNNTTSEKDDNVICLMAMREVNVELICDKDVKEPLVTTTGDSLKIFTYEVAFKSCHACPGGCGGGVGGSAAGIIGLVLIILLIVGLAAYFIIGLVINSVRFQKRGIEMIPQKNFWFGLPGLIKDGFIFTFKPIIDLIKNRGSKEKYQHL